MFADSGAVIWLGGRARPRARRGAGVHVLAARPEPGSRVRPCCGRWRPCHPKLASIRAATCSLLFDTDLQRVVIAVDRKYSAQHVQVRGGKQRDDVLLLGPLWVLQDNRKSAVSILGESSDRWDRAVLGRALIATS